jgi:hypothetical protein
MAKAKQQFKKGSKARVQVESAWIDGKIVAVTHEGAVAHLQRIGEKGDHKSIYARVESLRPPVKK